MSGDPFLSKLKTSAMQHLRRSLSSASNSSASEAKTPPRLPSRNPALNSEAPSPLPPPLPPARPRGGGFMALDEQESVSSSSEAVRRSVSEANVRRSNSVDRRCFMHGQLQQQQQQLFPILPSMAMSPPSVSSSSGRHSHSHSHVSVASPTRESLTEHNLRQHGHLPPPTDTSQRELEDLRGRCAQMEKTMRWWSDCTANWREKWSKVRAERNRLRDEIKRCNARLEASTAENRHLKSTALAVSSPAMISPAEVEHIRRENDLLRADLMQRTAELDRLRAPRAISHDRLVQTNQSRTSEKATETASCSEAPAPDLTVTSANFLLQEAAANQKSKTLSPSTSDSGVTSLVSSSSSSEAALMAAASFSRFLEDSVTQASASEQATVVKFRLEEALKTVEAERTDKQRLLRELDSLQDQIPALESQCDELRIARQEASRELLQTRSQGSETVRGLELRLEEEATKRTNLESAVGHLREEVERLQCENAEEWGRRERLETERQTSDRENRKLRSQLDDLRERNIRLTSQTSEVTSSELSRLQNLSEKNASELVELRHSQSRLRKTASEKDSELSHWKRKSESSEKEVRRLRLRVEELREALGRAEDENDESSNAIRRLQRGSEEMKGQMEGYEVQVEHLKSRLRAGQGASAEFALRKSSAPAFLGGKLPLSEAFVGDEDASSTASSEESLPIFDEDDEDELLGQSQIETDV